MAENIEKDIEKENDSAVNIRDLLYMCLSKWHWFVISLIICLGFAMYKVLKTPPVYSQSAQILIKETTKGKSASKSAGSSFDDFGIFTTSVNISNEMLMFRSSTNMEEVVRRLSLDMNYSAPGRFHNVTLYGSTLPIEVRLPDIANNQTASFEITLKPDNKVAIKDFKLNGEKIDKNKQVEGALADTLATPIGKVLILPSKHYEPVASNSVIYFSKSTLAGATARFRNELSVNQGEEKASIVMLRVNDVSVQRADDILASVIAVYNENWVRDKNQIAVSTSMFINDRLGIIENELGDVDSDISSYKSEHLIPDVQSAASMYMSQATQAEQNILQLNNQVYMARYVRNYLANDANRAELIPMSVGASDGLTSQISQYNDKMMERNQLVSISSEANPLVVEMDKNLNEMRNVMISSIDNQIVALNTQIRSLQGVGSKATSQIASNPGQAKYLLSVERQQKVKESLYLYLLQKREENELSQAFTAYNTRVIEAPGGSTVPVAPQKSKILLIAFVIGILIPLGIIYLREMMNTVVRGRKDLEALPLPFVGEIPETGKRTKRFFGLFGDKREKIGDAAVVVKEGSRNVINEAFRVVRTNLEFMLGTGEHHIVAITSANPGSGKTFVSFNLADSLAIKDKRVITIDLDLRKGSLSKFVNKPKHGIADFLAGRIDDPNAIICKNAAGTKVDLIPVGTLPPNPTELLFSPFLPELLETLKSHYDYVFLDCPPVEIVADAAIINQMADKTIFIIRAGLFERSMLPEVANFYTSGKYKNLCVLLNGTDGGDGHYGYKYGYKYGYRYGYKYGYHYGSYTKDE